MKKKYTVPADSRLRILVWFACLLPALSAARTNDSLERVLQNGQLSMKERITVYDDLSWGYMDSDMQKSLAFSRSGLVLAEKAPDRKMEATFYRNIGVAYYMGSVYDSATFHLNKALSIVQELGDSRMEALIQGAFGNLYRVQGLYNEALDSYLNAGGHFEEADSWLELGKVYSNIGGIYQIMNNDDQALRYLGKARKLAEQGGDQEGLASVYTSLSDIYLNQGKDKDSSLYYAGEALRIYRETGNRFNENMVLQTLAKIHYHHDDYAAALPIAREALHQAKELAFPSLVAYSLVILSNIHYHQGQYAQAIETAIAVPAYDSTNTNILRNVYANLSRAHAYLGEPDLAAKYIDRYRDVVDRYSGETYQQSLSAMEVKYETERKELKIESLEEQQQLYTWLGIAGAVILLMILAFVVIRYRLAVSSRKLAEQESRRLRQEKQLVSIQAALDGEAAERSRLARDLHDGLGSMLSVVKFTLPQVQGGAVLETADVSRFQKALGLLDESIQELRRVAHHMMPESLLRYGLRASLSDFCNAIPIVEFHSFGKEDRLPGKLEILVYRCVHELVSNALKHARASHINVQLVQEPDRLSFTVQDDGVGFDQYVVPEGMGLQNVRQRVEAYQGKMSIYSSGQGTEIHIELELTIDGDDKSSDR